MTADPTLAVETLDRGRELVSPALRDAVDRLDDHSRLVASYHLGWCDERGRPLEADPGKAVRPSLALLACEAVAGDPEPALCGAVAVELVHNFSLVHDDLMDRDAERRHRRTVWAVWGDATAVLVGDALLSLAHEVIDEAADKSGADHAPTASRTLAVATRELIRGQVLDMAFEQRDDVTLAECLDMAGAKTGALLGASAEIGAVLAGAPPRVCAAFRRYGAEIGLAFQLVDDLLGIWGWPERTGKPVWSDLRSRKKSLPVVWSLEHGGRAGRELAAWLSAPPEDPDDAAEEDGLRRAAGLVERAGGRRWATTEARERVRRAGAALDAAGCDPEHRRELDDLARFVVERDL